MRYARPLGLLPIVLATCLVLSACGSTPVTPLAEVPATLPRPEAARCGDGICDDAEQDNPALCPGDCQATATPTSEPPAPTSAPPSPTPVLPTSTAAATALPTGTLPRPPKSPAPGGRCGDGLCDEMEQKA